MNEPRILIVEDERIVAADLSKRLKEMGYEPVGQAARADRAVELAGELRPDLVLMDIRLEGKMDGITAARAIREQFRIPAVFLSANTEEETIARAREAEPFGYLVKPFEGRELRANIEMALYKHRAEEELRQAKEQYDELVRRISCGVYALRIGSDESLRMEYASPRAAELLGTTVEGMMADAKAAFASVHPEDEAGLWNAVRFAGERTTVFQWEGRYVVRGETRWLRINGEPVRGKESTVWSGVIDDITGRKRLEEATKQAHKLEAIRRLTGGMAHEFNNFLAGITLKLGLAEMQNPGGDVLELLEEMEVSCQSAARIIKQLLAFSSQSVIQPVPLDLGAMVAQVLEGLRPKLGDGIEVEFARPESLGLVKADRALMVQVVQDLCWNAREAMQQFSL